MDDSNQNDIEKYIHDKMDKNERMLFEKSMDSNAELKENVLLEINLHNSFNDAYETNSTLINDQKLIDDLKTELNTKELKETSDFIRKSTLRFNQKKKTPFKLIYKYTAAVAAML